jgi:hypothetical protein
MSFIGPEERTTAAGRRTGKPARERLSARGSIGRKREEEGAFIKILDPGAPKKNNENK